MSEPLAAEGLPHAARQVLATLVDMGRTRLELVTVELEEERLRLARQLLLAACTLFLAFVGALLAAAWAVFLCPPERRLVAAGIVTALYLGGALLCAWQWHRIASRRTPMFAESIEALRRDQSALRAGGPA